VPPDAFSSDGQLWGMPVFKWDILKERNYDWWLQRIKRNRELFDIIRIDHFRAFAAYWEVPASESTAKNGEWKPGPGKDFFSAIKSELGDLPFIAEDLGDVDETVFNLRDEFSFPGMKVLQFAFGGDMPHSVHIPHNHSKNFIVYTGTHDNNTTRGWYKQADDETKNSLKEYTGKDISEEDVHWVLAKMAYASVAATVILPMQDVLNLDENARMNIPASADSNWSWRLLPGQINKDIENKLKHLVTMYNR
jgi:4-alpha-glucanotransferase